MSKKTGHDIEEMRANFPVISSPRLLPALREQGVDWDRRQAFSRTRQPPLGAGHPPVVAHRAIHRAASPTRGGRIRILRDQPQRSLRESAQYRLFDRLRK